MHYISRHNVNMVMNEQAAALRQQLCTFLDQLDATDKSCFPRCKQNIRELVETLEDDFDMARCRKQLTREQLTKQLAYQKRRRLDVQSQVDEMSGKIASKIQNIWFVRVGLADPYVPAQTLSRFCRDFPGK